MILLQSAAFTDTLVTRLGDQLFSIVLLVVFAVYMLRKQKALEDKLDRYMAEDRDEMKNVIQKNTQAFDNLSARFAQKIITMLIVAICLAGCKTVKTSTSLNQADTSIGLQQYKGRDVSSSVFRYSKDTSITIEAKHTSGSVTADELEVAFTKAGKAIPRSYHTTSKGLTAYLVRDTNGTISYGCDADSFTIVVNRLITDSIVRSQAYDSLQLLYRQTQAKTVEQTETRKSGWFGNWGIYLLVAAVVAAFYLVKSRT